MDCRRKGNCCDEQRFEIDHVGREEEWYAQQAVVRTGEKWRRNVVMEERNAVDGPICFTYI